MSRTTKWAFAAVVVAVVAAAVFFTVRPRHGSLTIATGTGGGSGSKLALMTGPLGGTQNADRSACFWIQGSAGRTYLSWPAGWSAERNPLRVLDGHGVVMATSGQSVDLGGGFSPAAVAHCPTGQAHFSVGTVSVTRP